MYLIIILFLIVLFILIYFLFKDNFELLKKRYFYFLFISFFLVLFSIFSFYKEIKKTKKIQNSDIVFVLDVSSSMLALDYENNFSRLEVGKKIIQDFVLTYPNNRYALTIFAGEVMDILPLTSDINLFLNILSSVDDKSLLKGGTNIYDSLVSAISRFEENGGAIIFLSDFELPNYTKKDKDKYLEKIKPLSNTLKQKNIKLINIGIGSKKGNKILVGYDSFFGNEIYKKDKFMNDIITRFDEYFFNLISKELAMYKFEVLNLNYIQDIIKNIKDIPSKEDIGQLNYKQDLSRYTMILSYLFFLGYLFFYFLDKRLGK